MASVSPSVQQLELSLSKSWGLSNLSHSSAVFRGELLRLPLAHLALCCDTYVTEIAPDPPSTYSPVGQQIVTAQDHQGWDGGNRDRGVRARMGKAQDPSGEGVCSAQPEGSKVYLN